MTRYPFHDTKNAIPIGQVGTIMVLAFSLQFIMCMCTMLGTTVSSLTFASLPRDFARHAVVPSTILNAKRYGPPADPNTFEDDQDNQLLIQRKIEFRSLINKILNESETENLPSLITKDMELILSLSGEDGVQIIEAILEDVMGEEGQEAAERISAAIELTISFAEEFVEQALLMDDQNKQLLGKIIKTMSNKDMASREREDALDELLEKEKRHFTPGFLRHIEGECDRILSAPKISPESSRLLETLRVVQARVLEELGNDLGEAAQVLNQLIGYDTKAERLAVLEAGLMIRGTSFAEEMLSLTEEALEGFSRSAANVDQELVERVQEIDEKIRQFLQQETVFE